MKEPVFFIFGALRSGTTLFRLMLNSHKGLHNPGEADFLFDFLHPDATHASGWRYDIAALERHRIFKAHSLTIPEGMDGLDLLRDFLEQWQSRHAGRLSLNVHRHADRIKQALPEARFVHLLRDGRDVARSSIGMGWAGNSYFGVDHWITTEAGWDAAQIDSERVLSLRFEDLMADIDTHLRAVCDFMGVAFSDEMLTYHEETTYGPPDPNIAQQWKRRASAHEIALIEGRCGDLLEARGYVLNGAPAQPGAIEAALLTIQNRTGRWRFNIRRFGLPLFIAGHLSKRLGPKALYHRVKERMDAKTIKALK